MRSSSLPPAGPNGRSEAVDTLQRVPFFACLSAGERADLRRQMEIRDFHKNAVILLEEQTSEYMYVVFAGRVKAVKASPEGREHILAIHEAGDFFGEMALLDGRTSPATVVAMGAARVGLLDKAAFERCLSRHRTMQRAIIALLCSRLREAWSTIGVLTHADAERRLRTMLARIGARFGEEACGGTLIGTGLTHQDIADYAAVSRETATRLLDRLKKAGEIEMRGRGAILLKPVFFEKAGPL